MNNRLQQFLELENLTPARLADMLGVQRSGLSHILSGRNKPGYEFIYKLLTRFPAISADWLLTGKGKPYKEMNRQSNYGNSPAAPSTDFTSTFSSEKKKPEEEAFYTGTTRDIPYRNKPYDNQPYAHIQYTHVPYDHISYIDKQFDAELFPEKQTPEASGDIKKDDSVSLWDQKEDFSVSLPETEKRTSSEIKTKQFVNQQNKADFKEKYPPENSINETRRVLAREKREIKRVIVFYNDGSFEELFPAVK